MFLCKDFVCGEEMLLAVLAGLFLAADGLTEVLVGIRQRDDGAMLAPERGNQ